MDSYTVTASWLVEGKITLSAESPANALALANEIDLDIFESDFVEESFKVMEVVKGKKDG